MSILNVCRNCSKLIVVFALLLAISVARAQTTTFTYQGRLTDGGTPANGNYDLQFALFDSLSGGAQVGSTQTLNTVAVSNGVFTLSLDFGANAFPGASRFLEISARPSGVGSFTLLTPRQPITSTPYAMRSLNAATADSVPASGVPAGSGNYIQNSSSPQSSSNFNISGNGLAGGTLSGNVVNATTQYNLNGSRILGNQGNFNLFAGVGAGQSNTSGFNSFFGFNAGTNNTTGEENAFFGLSAGASNTTGGANSFFGSRAGLGNTTGDSNSFFGWVAGRSNTTGKLNSFFGSGAGNKNTTGLNNSFFGWVAGEGNTTGTLNSFFGSGAGSRNTTGNLNTIIGFAADVGSNNLSNATAIGARAEVDASNALVLGSINGVNSATASVNVGIGTTAPAAKLDIKGSGPTDTALQISSGGIKVLGAGLGTSTPVFIHRATAGNTACGLSQCTTIDHPLTNGDPNAILIVTPNYNPGGAVGTYDNHPIGVFYNGARWLIFNQDLAAMPVNAAFNVLVVKP